MRSPAAAVSSTSADWGTIDERHRRELLRHCYRMLGSPFDAEEAVQETMFRAWRGRETFAGAASVRVWLFRIATNICLDMLRQRPRREQPIGAAGAADADSLLGRPDDSRWLHPAPDRWLLPSGAATEEVAVLRESIRFAFIAALHRLTPMQRAALIFRDVLKFTAEETADLLGITVASANGLLRRARHRLAAEAPPPTSSADLDGGQRALLERFVHAFERYDVQALTELLKEDATLSMPPYELWLAGRSQIRRWFLRDPNPCHGARAVAIGANGSPALAIYHLDEPHQTLRPFAILTAAIEDDRIAALDMHIVPRLFPLAGLPTELPVADAAV